MKEGRGMLVNLKGIKEGWFKEGKLNSFFREIHKTGNLLESELFTHTFILPDDKPPFKVSNNSVKFASTDGDLYRGEWGSND